MDRLMSGCGGRLLRKCTTLMILRYLKHVSKKCSIIKDKVKNIVIKMDLLEGMEQLLGQELVRRS
jgi:glycerol-3-phosphate responsive antiterminator